MLNSTRRGLLAGAAMLATLVVSGLAYAADPIKVWHHGGRGDGERGTIEALIKEWNAANPNTPAVLEVQPEGAYNEQVQAAAASKTLPDLLDFDGPNYANYVWSGFLQPLNGLISEDMIKDTIPSLIAQGTYAPDGKLYSISGADSGLAIWGRKSLLQKAGVRIPTGVADAWTMAEFEDALAKLAKIDGIKYPLDLKANYGKGEWYTYGFGPIIQSYGADLIDRKAWKADGAINSPKAVEALSHMASWVKNGWVAPASEGDDTFYGKKTAALSFVGHWMWAAHSKALGDDLVLLPMPNWGGKHVTGNGGWCWGVSKSSKDPKAVGKLIEFLLSTKNVAAAQQAGGAVPGRASAGPLVDLYKDGAPLNLYLKQLQAGSAVPRPAHPAYPKITASFAEAVDAIIAGKDVKASLDAAAKAIDTDIADNKGYPPFGKM